jgi:hypothetical protein
MNWKRILILPVAAGLITLTAVAATELYGVRDFLAAFLMFGILLAAVGIVILLAYFVGEAVVRCVRLLGACAALARLHQPASSVVVPLAHGVGKS